MMPFFLLSSLHRQFFVLTFSIPRPLFGPYTREGVPGASLASHNEKYFAYHHSHGDQMSVLDKVDMDLAAAVFAVTAYVIADLEEPLPKTVPGHIKKKGEEGEEKGFVSVEEQTQREFI